MGLSTGCIDFRRTLPSRNTVILKRLPLDCVIFSFVRQLYRVDESIIDGYQVPAVSRWIRRIIDADYFNDVMKKVEVWSV